MNPTETRYRWKLLRAGPLWLDGGSMFGVVPRAVWGRRLKWDEDGRIELAHNCLLLERCGGGEGPRRVLIETGSGDKSDAKMRRIFGLGEGSVADAVTGAGCRPEEVDVVIVSHLHFDHAGGVTRLARPGEKPDWTGPGGLAVKFAFDRAAVIVQRQEMEDALAGNSVMTRTYLRENLEPISHRARLVESPPPFPVGPHPGRDALPRESLERRITRVLPGIDVFLVPGHTWGQQAVRFTDDHGRVVVFSADTIPTVHHVGAAYNMAYDVEPFISTLTRRWLLDAAASNNWVLVLDHEPGNPVHRVRADGKGWYELESLSD